MHIYFLPLTFIVRVFHWFYLGSAAVLKLPKSKAREFDLKATVHQTGARL